jgi:hypothetical protein
MPLSWRNCFSFRPKINLTFSLLEGMGGGKWLPSKIAKNRRLANFRHLAKIRFFIWFRFSTFVYAQRLPGTDRAGRAPYRTAIP